MRTLIILLAFLFGPVVASAAPLLNVTRTPASGAVWTAETVYWVSQGATKVQYSCSGPFSGKGILPVSGSVPDIYREEWIGTTECEWWAIDKNGESSARIKDTFTVTPTADPGKQQVNEAFAITSINGQRFTGDSILIPSGTNGIVLEGTGVPGSRIFVSEVKVNSDFGEGNEPVGDDGKWRMTFLSKSYAPGVHYFKLSGYKQYTAISVEMLFSLTILPSELPAKPEWIKCIVDGHGTATNTYLNFGETAECSVITSDPNTKAMLSSGYTSWGSMGTSKDVEPRGNTVIPGSYLNGVYTVKITGDYHGYSLSRNLWFENSAGQTSMLSIGMSDPNSDDYAQAEAALDKERAEYYKYLDQVANATANTPVQVFNTLGITLTGSTSGIGLAYGITISKEGGKTIIRWLPAAALTNFSANGFGASEQTIVVKSDRHNRVIRASVRKKTSASDTALGWWVDSSGVQDADSKAALKNFLVSGRNVIHFGSVDASWKETSGADVIYEVGMPASATPNGGEKTTPAFQNGGSSEPAYGNDMTPISSSGSKKKPYTAPVTLAPLQPAGNPGIMPLSPAAIEKAQAVNESVEVPPTSKVSPAPFIAKPQIQTSKKAEREKNRLLRKSKSTRTK